MSYGKIIPVLRRKRNCSEYRSAVVTKQITVYLFYYRNIFFTHELSLINTRCRADTNIYLLQLRGYHIIMPKTAFRYFNVVEHMELL